MIANLIGSSYSTHGRQLLRGHLEAAVAADRPDGRLEVGELRADRRRHLEAHRAEAAGGDEAVRLVDPEVLRRPHLVLADAGDVVGVGARGVVDRLDHVLRQDFSVSGMAMRRVLLALISSNQARHSSCLAGVDLRLSCGSTLFTSPTIGTVVRDVLADLGRVDVDVDDLGVGREVLETARDAVVEAHADADERSASLDRRCCSSTCRACRACPWTARACRGSRRGRAAS